MPVMKSGVKGCSWHRVKKIPYLNAVEWRDLRLGLYVKLNDVELSRIEVERDMRSGNVSLYVTDNRNGLLGKVTKLIDKLINDLSRTNV